ncbi:Imm26 family immunity protein [Marivirga sp.]|uniref:Imm26 family immunity protein n=1 Tax=Marivirga sp. TaxID=2018662 RepID=UPI003DA799DD
MKKQKITIGDIVEIKIESNFYCYAQILPNAGYAFFDIKSSSPIDNIEKLNDVPILFILSVYNDVITEGLWLKVGKLPIRDTLKQQPLQFIQDQLNPDKFELYNPNTGESKQAEKGDCKGLERASVWEAEEVEERLLDHFKGRKNRLVEEDRAVFE